MLAMDRIYLSIFQYNLYNFCCLYDILGRRGVATVSYNCLSLGVRVCLRNIVYFKDALMLLRRQPLYTTFVSSVHIFHSSLLVVNAKLRIIISFHLCINNSQPMVVLVTYEDQPRYRSSWMVAMMMVVIQEQPNVELQNRSHKHIDRRGIAGCPTLGKRKKFGCKSCVIDKLSCPLPNSIEEVEERSK